MTLYKLIEIIKNISLKHPNVGSVNEGDIYTINSSPSVKYANVTITQNSHSQDSTYDHYGLTLFYTDRLVDDMESNRLQIQSTGKQMLSNIINYICDEFDVECENISFQPFTQRFTDECAGVYATITVDVIKETLCAEEYWNESWTAPIITIRNEKKKVQFTENGVYTIEYDEENYTGLGKVEVEVNLDLDSVRNEGYQDGYQEGYDIGIESSYQVGYDDGYDKGNEDGYANGYDKGNEDGVANAEVILAETAQEVEVTRNGYYLTKYVDDVYVYPDIVTGDFGDGTYFYDWSELQNGCYNTEVLFEDGVIELWWKQQATKVNTYIFGCGSASKSNFGVLYQSGKMVIIKGLSGYCEIPINIEEWQHLKIETNGYVYLNGNKVDGIDLSTISHTADDTPFLINCSEQNLSNYANGLFGMVKINDNIFIPKDGGFINYHTNEQLGGYIKPTTDVAYQYNSEGSEITGYFDDGTPFYGSAELYNAVFYTDIIGTTDSSFEVWWKDKNNSVDDYATIVGVKQDSNSVFFKIVKRSTGLFRSEYGSDVLSGLDYYEFRYDMSNWTHIKFSKKDGLIVNGELLHSVADKYGIINTPNNKFQINDVEDGRYANGVFGMVKINGKVFIPTEKGFMNYSNKTYLPANVVIGNEKPQFIGNYIFKENPITIYKGEGNLIKSVTVNVPPLLKTDEMKLSFAYSSFVKIPEDLIDWTNVKSMKNMFRGCKNLVDLGDIDTSNVTDMENAFGGISIVICPPLNTSNVTNMKSLFIDCSKLEEVGPMDTSKVTNMYAMFNNFSGEYPLRKLPEFDCSSLTDINQYFAYSGYQNKRPKLTDCGGWKNIKCNWNDGYGLNHCPNLTYESCINILNGLYDFTGNGLVPTSSQGNLKVHQNFIDLVGDEINIAISKGWKITA